MQALCIDRIQNAIDYFINSIATPPTAINAPIMEVAVNFSLYTIRDNGNIRIGTVDISELAMPILA